MSAFCPHCEPEKVPPPGDLKTRTTLDVTAVYLNGFSQSYVTDAQLGEVDGWVYKCVNAPLNPLHRVICPKHIFGDFVHEVVHGRVTFRIGPPTWKAKPR